MSIIRHYVMRAAEGKSQALEAGLADLAKAVRALPGSLGVELLKDRDDANRFVFLERWESVEAHGAAGKALTPAVMGPVIEASAGRPEGCYLESRLTV